MLDKITDMKKAKQVSRQGLSAAIIISVITTIMIIVNMGGFDILDIGFLAFIDVLLFVIIGFGIYKMSRIAAVLGLCLYIVEQIFMIADNGFSVNYIGIMIIILFINGIRGTFAYHKFKKLEENIVA